MFKHSYYIPKSVNCCETKKITITYICIIYKLYGSYTDIASLFRSFLTNLLFLLTCLKVSNRNVKDFKYNKNISNTMYLFMFTLGFLDD